MMEKRHLPDWIDSYMNFTENSEPPESFRRWVAISVLAAVLRRKCFLPWGPMTFYPNLYVVLCSPPGKARKGTAMGPGLDFLMEPELNTKLAAEAITREALIRELADSRDYYSHSESNLTIVHSSLTVYSQELTVFLGYRNMTLLGDLTDWFDCRKRWTYRTKGQGTDIIEGVFVNLIGATTPHMIQTHLPPEAVGVGLTSRIIFIYEREKAKSIALPLQSNKDIALRELLFKDLAIICLYGGPYQPTEGFLAAYTTWYDAQSKTPPFRDEKFSGYIERRPTFILKMSMIMSASRGGDMMIAEEDLYRAIFFLQEAEKSMRTALSGVGQGEYAGLMAAIMAELAVEGTMTFQDILRRHYHDAGKREIEAILETLESLGVCSYIINTGEIVYNKEFK